MNPLSSENCDRYERLFFNHRLILGRRLPEVSPSFWNGVGRRVLRHADIFAVNAGYCWHGDLDLLLDGPALRAIADALGEQVFVLYEATRRNLTLPLTDAHLTLLSDWNSRDGQRL